ncbi:helix-turn-helix domain-containing protein [Rhizobium sp. CG5]|uniref:helix-turn-helix domain-containing protein n=1 Tax=Rhizobium sp. CG5 TaxID=2726076 RepID=UPI0020348A92|nr:XRE family transcriptional regulator [Rhizobium sp. CG5]MCM2477211.1 helix-turn-helix domain-containing protein [Rhizobium sp. CG5]
MILAAKTSLGMRIKTLRKARNLTLDALATLAATDKGYLSRLERGMKSPTVATLLKLSEALGVPMGELLGEQIASDVIHVTRKSERVPIGGEEGGGMLQSLSGNSSSLSAFIIHPETEFTAHRPESAHAGEEFLLTLSGSIEIRFPDRGFVLDEGDSLIFPGHLPHRVRRVGDQPSSALVVVGRGQA